MIAYALSRFGSPGYCRLARGLRSDGCLIEAPSPWRGVARLACWAGFFGAGLLVGTLLV